MGLLSSTRRARERRPELSSRSVRKSISNEVGPVAPSFFLLLLLPFFLLLLLPFFLLLLPFFFSFLNPDQLHRLPPFSDFERGRRQTTSAGTSERVRVRAGTTSSTPLSFSPRGREEVEKKKKKKKRAQERVKNFHHPRPPPSCSPLLESLHGAEEERQGRESRAREERVPFFAERQEVSVFRLQRRESEKQEEKK